MLESAHDHQRLLSLSLQIFGDFSSVSGISPVIKNSSNIHHSLASFGHSESSLQSRAGSSSLNCTNQSTPSLKTHVVDSALKDQQDSVSGSHHEASSGAKSSEIDYSNSSLKVPIRDISSPYNSLRHTGGTRYQSTSSVAEAKALEVSLNLPDHSEGTVSEDSTDPSSFKKQHDIDGYCSHGENEMDSNLTIEDKHVSSFHSDEEQHLLDNTEGSEYKLKIELKSLQSFKTHEKLRFEKKLSAGQLV